MWTLFVVLVILPAIGLSDPCLLQCKDDHMNRMQESAPAGATRGSPELGSTLAAPLQYVLRRSSRRSVRRRMADMCGHHDQFLACIARCNSSNARELLELGQESWASMCSAYRTDRRFAHQILPCLADYSDELEHSCARQSLIIQDNFVELLRSRVLDSRDVGADLGELCTSIVQYDECFISAINGRCGERAWQFILDLSTKSTMSDQDTTSCRAIEMIRQWAEVADLPTSCRTLASAGEYALWHQERLQAEEEFSRLTQQSRSVINRAVGIDVPVIVLILPIMVMILTGPHKSCE